MHTDEFLIEKTIKLFESNTGWGDSAEWTNQDFVILSEKIQERTGVALSHVTLKRVWGKVKYDSLPNTHTLDTLVQFLGYQNWRDFKCQNGNGKAAKDTVTEIVANGSAHNEVKEVKLAPVKRKAVLKGILVVAALSGATLLVFSIKKSEPKIIDKDYSFSSKKVVSEGVPNSVIFNYDATKSPYDSVVIQQSWDKHLAVRVSKNEHQHTSIYYYPDYYKAKLIVGGKVVSMHRLLIKSDGWVPIVTLRPIPVYFSKTDAMSNGKFGLSVAKIESRNIKMQPSPPYVIYSNVQDLGEIYSDDFVFETSLRNDYNLGAGACQTTNIYILCEGTAIAIPLCAKGCVSNADLIFTNYFASGKQNDLSMFGVDFSSYVKVRVESKNGKGTIFINDKPVYTIAHDVARSKIIGFDYSFEGTGSIDYVKLTNDKVHYEDDF
jgi:hypothetical protein